MGRVVDKGTKRIVRHTRHDSITTKQHRIVLRANVHGDNAACKASCGVSNSVSQLLDILQCSCW
jgi:hypothetical protein